MAECLRWTVAANALTNVEVHNIAVSDAPGTVEISTDLDAHVHNSVFENGLYLTSGQTQTVNCETLDSLLAAVEHVDWLKMNIEGAERQALVGAEQVLSRTDHVVISCHDFVADAGGPPALRTAEFVTELLQDHGFAISRRADPRGWVRDQVWGNRN